METQIEMATVRQTTLPPGRSATHQARSGKFYTLHSDADCNVPLEDAYTFLCDPAFEVKDNTGVIITPPSSKKVEAGRVDLDDDEVIARLDELTGPALLKRCKRFHGSEDLKQNAKKTNLIAFLVKQNEERATHYGVARGSEGMPQQMDADTLDKMGLDLSAQL